MFQQRFRPASVSGYLSVSSVKATTAATSIEAERELSPCLFVLPLAYAMAAIGGA